MFALSQLVDIPQLFRRLDALPQELATARQELWAATVQADEAQKEYNQHHLHSKDAASVMKEAWGRFLAMREEQTIRKDNLANLLDEMSTLRMKVDLITALGRQEVTAPSRREAAASLLAQTLEAMRRDKERSAPGQDKETALEAETSPSLGFTEAGDPIPF